MPLFFAGQQFDLDRTTALRNEYVTALDNDVLNDILVASTVDPKRNNLDLGNRKATFIRAKSVQVLDAAGSSVMKDVSVRVTMSIPVGASSEELVALCAEIGDLAKDPKVIADAQRGRVNLTSTATS